MYLISNPRSNHMYPPPCPVIVCHPSQHMKLYVCLFYVLLRVASRLLMAVLSIPLPLPQTESDKYLMFDEVAREKSRRLATLLGLQTVPTRKKLVSDLVSKLQQSMFHFA